MPRRGLQAEWMPSAENGWNAVVVAHPTLSMIGGRLARRTSKPRLGHACFMIPGDSPITRPDEETLECESVARSFAAQVMSLDSSQGLVVGVLGPWGSGKTSFLNLAREHLQAGATILDFNPWMFSGTEQLTHFFFTELSSQLKLRPGLSGIAGALEDYSEVVSGLGWLPLLGPWVERSRAASNLVAKVLGRRKEG